MKTGAAWPAAASRLALGTVQFGLRYGIANSSGQVPPEGVAAILATAASAGIDTLDTAIAYGESEGVLGKLHSNRFRVITKLPPVPTDIADVGAWIRAQVQGSLDRLQVDTLYGLLLHRPEQLLSDMGDEIFRQLMSLRNSGQIVKIGVSVYDPLQLEQLSSFSFDLVQAPLSIFDQRMLRSGWLDRLRMGGVAFHARSIFLQGLLLMRPDQRPAQFSAWAKAWNAWDAWLVAHRLTALQACVRFAIGIQEIDRVVIGVDSDAQLLSILAAVKGPMAELPPALAEIEPQLLNPANWSK